jgi:dihydrolipoamide dehydrogenase
MHEGLEPNVAGNGKEVFAEVLVLGAGPGGYTAAFRAADLGKRVVLVEREAELGGVCLNVGCIPSKALLHAAKLVEDARAMAAHGIRFGEPAIDLDALRAWKDGVVGRLTKGLRGLAKQRGVQVIQGEGRFAGPNALTVEGPAGGRTVGFQQAIVAAGSRSVHLPFLPDDPRVWDSTSALALAALPSRMLVIGGGIIGLEMACVYAALGARITLVELSESLLPGCDPDLVSPLRKRVERRYEQVRLGTRVTAVESREEGLRVTFEGAQAPAEPETYEAVLVAIGRRPNGDRIGAEQAGIGVNDNGFIAVDRQMRTNVAHIFAIGDVVGMPMLAHKATHEGKVAAEVCAGLKRYFDTRIIPSVAYTDPEVAWVGLTESDAEAQGIRYTKGLFPWAASGRALGMGRGEGATKLLFAEGEGRLLGAGMVGAHAGDLIAEAALAIEMGCDVQDISCTVHPHPTLSETLAMAAEIAEGTITDLYVPKDQRR